MAARARQMAHAAPDPGTSDARAPHAASNPGNRGSTMVAPSTPAGNGKLPDTSSLTAVRAEIHQATGIVSVQLGVTPAAALDHLQSYAHAHQRPLGEIAADVIAHRLSFNPEP
jgi:hypothetical protein